MSRKESPKLEIVKLQARKVKETNHYSITIPKDFVRELKWEKGDILALKKVKLRIDNEDYEGLFVFKPKLP